MTMVKVTLVRSMIGTNKKVRDTLRSLGLTKMHKTVYKKNTPQIRGMLNKVIHMVRLEIVEDEESR